MNASLLATLLDEPFMETSAPEERMLALDAVGSARGRRSGCEDASSTCGLHIDDKSSFSLTCGHVAVLGG